MICLCLLCRAGTKLAFTREQLDAVARGKVSWVASSVPTPPPQKKHVLERFFNRGGDFFFFIRLTVSVSAFFLFFSRRRNDVVKRSKSKCLNATHPPPIYE